MGADRFIAVIARQALNSENVVGAGICYRNMGSWDIDVLN
jgi:hypothetical protein